MPFNQLVDIAWRKYRALLKAEGADQEQLSFAQEAFKEGWREAEVEFTRFDRNADE